MSMGLEDLVMSFYRMPVPWPALPRLTWQVAVLAIGVALLAAVAFWLVAEAYLGGGGSRPRAV